MLQYVDQLGRTIFLQKPPVKIISLVPSITELLCDMNLEDEVIGITKFCVRPEKWHQNKQRIGGTKNVHPEIVSSLSPDLIIANKEENVKEQIEQLEKIAPVWISDINTYSDALEMISSIGKITNRSTQAQDIITKIEVAFNKLKIVTHQNKAVYLIWKDPYMTIGGDTFINEMLNKAGYQNLFEKHTRYPIITLEEIIQSTPDCILLSSEPYPFKEIHQKEFEEKFPSTKITLVDGEMFSWYGSRMIQAPQYFLELHQQL